MRRFPALAAVALSWACVVLMAVDANGQASDPPRSSPAQSRTRATPSKKAETGTVYVSNKTLMSVTVTLDQLVDANGKTQTFEGVSWTLSPGMTYLTRKDEKLR